MTDLESALLTVVQTMSDKVQDSDINVSRLECVVKSMMTAIERQTGRIDELNNTNHQLRLDILDVLKSLPGLHAGHVEVIREEKKASTEQRVANAVRVAEGLFGNITNPDAAM